MSKAFNLTIITVTFCLAFLGWGTIIVTRTVTDKNYHPLTAEQQKIKAFQDCTNEAYGNANTQCKALVDGK